MFRPRTVSTYRTADNATANSNSFSISRFNVNTRIQSSYDRAKRRLQVYSIGGTEQGQCLSLGRLRDYYERVGDAAFDAVRGAIH